MKTLRNGLYYWEHDRNAIFILKDNTYRYIKNGRQWDSRMLIGNEDHLIMITMKHYYEKV